MRNGPVPVRNLINALPTMNRARKARQLTPNGVTISANGSQSPSDSVTSALGPESKTRVYSRQITRLQKGPTAKVIIHISNRSQIFEDFTRHEPKYQLNGTFAQ